MSLTLFFTANTGLTNWDAGGNLERELALYRIIGGQIGDVNLVTYGGSKDHSFADRLNEFKICSVPWRRRQLFTVLDVGIRYSSTLSSSSVFKTNQMRGAEIPLRLKKVYRKPLVVRCGFLHSYFTMRQGDDLLRLAEAERLEKKAFQGADMIFLTSSWQRDYVLDKYRLSPELVKVVPNYVQTDHFRPLPDVDKKFDLVYVGRGTEQKNLVSLLEALAILKSQGKDVHLLTVGSCANNRELHELSQKQGLTVDFRGQVSTRELPEVLNSAKAFILPSHYEGHPKAMLEAMSCGICCIGTRVDGIKQELEHLSTGFLSGTSSEDLAESIDKVLHDDSLRTALGKSGRERVVGNFSLEKVAAIELQHIKTLLN